MNFIKPLIFFTIAISFFSCNGSKQDSFTNTDAIKEETKLDSQKISAQNVFNSLPTRSDILELVNKANAQYNPDLLNNPENTKKYTVESSMALNLGVYGADLYVTGVFEQTQESMLFLKCTNILAKNLGVSNSFDEKMVDRMEANKSNRDSTMGIITDSFKKTDKFLTENGRPGTSSLIVVGTWIESIYIACNIAKVSKSEGIIKQIFSQKESLKHLITLVDNSKIPDDSKFIIRDLEELNKLFLLKTDVVFNVESIKNIQDKATEIRKKIILD